MVPCDAPSVLDHKSRVELKNNGKDGMVLGIGKGGGGFGDRGSGHVVVGEWRWKVRSLLLFLGIQLRLWFGERGQRRRRIGDMRQTVTGVVDSWGRWKP